MSFFIGIGKMVLAMLLLIGIGITSCEVNKAYWDRQVRELCELDGGVVVYEQVTVNKPDYVGARYTSKGTFILPDESEITFDDEYFLRSRLEVLKKGLVQLRKHEDYVIRVEGGGVLGKRTIYSRVGGDFPTGIMHHSSFSCRDIEEIDTNLSASIFNIEGN